LWSVFLIIPIPVRYEKKEKDDLSLGDTNIVMSHHFQHYPIMETTKISKSKAIKIIEIIEYIPNSMVFKTILRKRAGNGSLIAFDICGSLPRKKVPFDNFIQIIGGKVEIVIDGISNFLGTGQSIIIPTYSSNSIKSRQRFKMMSTIVKDGYEQSSLPFLYGRLAECGNDVT
jgi:hypothetical protein